MRIFRLLLLPFSILYLLGVSLRNMLFDLNIIPTTQHDISTIGVGNLSVGGTGKTPHAIYIIDLLLKKGFQVGTLSRGYKRKTTGFLEVTEEHTVDEVGDEPRLVKKRFGKNLVVGVDGNRNRGVRKLQQSHKDLESIVLDDVYQHRYINPGLKILLTEYSNLYINDFVLPLGTLREPARASRRADIIIVTKCPRIFSPTEARAITKKLSIRPYQKVFFSYYKYKKLKPVFNDRQLKSFSEKELLTKDLDVVMLTGIARTANLKYRIKNQVKRLRHHKYEDHHRFTLTEIERLVRDFKSITNEKKIILTTEKDMQRLSYEPIKDLLAGLPVYYLEIGVEFLGRYKEAFEEEIEGYVRRNKGIN